MPLPARQQAILDQIKDRSLRRSITEASPYYRARIERRTRSRPSMAYEILKRVRENMKMDEWFDYVIHGEADHFFDWVNMNCRDWLMVSRELDGKKVVELSVKGNETLKDNLIFAMKSFELNFTEFNDEYSSGLMWIESIKIMEEFGILGDDDSPIDALTLLIQLLHTHPSLTPPPS